MASDNKIHMPGVFGGLTRYDNESKSKISFTPEQVVGMIIAIILFVTLMKFFFPIVA